MTPQHAAHPASQPASQPATAAGFAALNLLPELLRAVADQGYDEPTPIQARAIPVVLEGRDLLAAAQTGTGKTAGFMLPILQRLHRAGAGTHASAPRGKNDRDHRNDRGGRAVRALILVPTRELAAQVQECARDYGKYLRVASTTVYGGMSMHAQVQALRRGVEILVATPGRLLDHIQQRTVDLSKVEVLVLDEADRMLDMGFIHDIRRVLAVLPKQRQNLLFSATFSEEIRTLSAQFLHDPATIEIARRNAPIELVTQVVHPVDKDRKRDLLMHLVETGDWQQVLVFAKTKHGANRLAELLSRDGISADAIHGNKSQPQRMRALSRFKSGDVRVLVATDIAARGIDIDALPHVVNYDLPNVPEDYVHRIGRTGRAGSTGDAVSLVSGEDRPLLAAIERLIGRRITQQPIPGFEPPAHSYRAEARPHPGHRPGAPKSAPRSAPGGGRGRRQGGSGAPAGAASGKGANGRAGEFSRGGGFKSGGAKPEGAGGGFKYGSKPAAKPQGARPQGSGPRGPARSGAKHGARPAAGANSSGRRGGGRPR